MRKHRKLKIALILLVIAAALGFWFFYPLRSYIVMGVYSAQQRESSVMKAHGFSVDIPSGPGWYPFVLTYNADGFAQWSGIDAEMSIDYNFGAFDAATRTSSIYDINSNKYSSFYGAYTVHKDGDAFGLREDGGIDMREVTLAVEYDYTQLVLANFGCGEPVFSVGDYETRENVEYAGSGGWTRIDAVLTTNGLAHHYREEKLSYLQYGSPTQAAGEDFRETQMAGRIYVKYFEPYDCTVMLYVIAPDTDAVQQCDDAVLRYARISER